MNFNDSEERRLIRESLSGWLSNNYDLQTRQAAQTETSGYSSKAWRELCELGIPGALQSEAVGGYGGTGYDIALVFEELGRRLAIEPWLSSALVGTRLAANATMDQELIASVIAGEHLIVLAHGEPDGGYDSIWVNTTAVRKDSEWTLSGHKAVVVHGDCANTLIVSARVAGEAGDRDGLALFAVPSDTAGLQIRGYQTIDGLRAADIQLQSVSLPATAKLDVADIAIAIEQVHAAGCLAVCAEALGIMEVARDITAEYLRTREQFGRPIGSFQALQHRMVDVATVIEQSRSLVIKAAGVLDEEPAIRDAALSAAKFYIGESARRVAEESIQMHGGIGMARVTPINHYARRLVMIDHYFGDTDFHLGRYAALSN